ncbi:hypothetical protein Tco_1072134 [Tanacetum coccineum]
MSSSIVTYTSVYTDSEPWRFYWVSNEEPQAPAKAPPSPDYMPGPEHPPYLDYVSGPEYPPSPDYMHGPKEPEQAPLFLDYEDPEEDPEEDHADYCTNGGDDADDESSDDDDDDVEEDEEDKEEEEEEHLAPADSSVVPTIDHVPSAEDTEVFETNKSAPTPVPLPRRRMDRMSIRPPTPMSATAEALIVEYASAPTPPSPPPSLLTRFTTPASGFEVGESLAAAAARQPVLDVATVDATLGRLVSREVGYGIEDVWDDMVGDMEERAPTTIEGLSQRVTDLSTTLARDTHEIHVRLEDPQDDRALQRGRVNMLFRDRRFHRHISMLLESEARHAQEAWLHSIDCSRAVHAELQAYRAQVNIHEIQIQTRDTRIGSLETLVAILVAQTSSLQTQLTTTLRHIQIMEAREPARTDDPEDAGSSC